MQREPSGWRTVEAAAAAGAVATAAMSVFMKVWQSVSPLEQSRPALGILPPPKDKPRERSAMLVGAHLVWGSVLGLVFSGLRPKAHAVPPLERG